MTLIKDSPTGISNSIKGKISVNPNPSSSIFNIDLSKNNNSITNYKVVDNLVKTIQNGATREAILKVNLSEHEGEIYLPIIDNFTIIIMLK